MARYSDIRREQTIGKNMEILKRDIEGRYHVPVPEKVIDQIKSVEYPLAKIFVHTYEEFDKLFIATALPEHTCCKLGSERIKGLSVLHVYSPELEERVREVSMQERRENAWKLNASKVTWVSKFFNLTKEQEANLAEVVKSIECEVAKVMLISTAAFFDRFGGSPNESNYALVEQDTYPPQPLLYVSSPNFEETLAQSEKVKSLTSTLKNKYKLVATEKHMDFFYDVLPRSIPKQIEFEGSRVRAENLSKKPGVSVYGAVKDEIFAVEYLWYDTPKMTIFVSELSPEMTYAVTQLMPKLKLSFKEAMRVSEVLTHDRFYRFTKYSDYMEYITKIPKLWNLQSGDTVNDIIQGTVSVVGEDSYADPLAIDIDDAYHSVFVVGENEIHAYIPQPKENA